MTAKFLPWAGLVAVFVASMAMLLPAGDGTHASFLCSVVVMLNAVILIFPLIAGVAAVDATALVRGRSRFLIEALPPAGRFRVAFGRVWRISLAGCGGLLLATVAAGVLAVSQGSRLSWGVWSYLLLGAAGVVSATSAGWVIGAVIKSWFVPPLLILVFYGGAAVNNSYIGVPSAVLTTIWTPYAAFVRPSWGLLIAALGVHGLIGAAGVAGWLVWSGRSPLRIVVLAVTCILAGGTIGAAANGWMWPAENIVPVDTSQWICAPLRSGGQVCAPPERPQDLPALVGELDDINARFLELDGALETRVWRAVDSPAGTSLVYVLPLGRAITPSEHAAAAAGDLFTACLLSALDPPDQQRLDEIAEMQAIVNAWVDPSADHVLTDPSGNSRAITLAEARSAYEASKLC